MYKTHPIFKQPENEDLVWRYMDFTKFVSLIESQCLYFARADKLGDPFEGSLPKKTVEKRNSVQKWNLDHSLFPEHQGIFDKHVALKDEMNQEWRKFYAINCWHMSVHESAAMWKLYSKSNESVAVQSTYQKLRESIRDAEDVYIGKVQYIDYENESISHYYDNGSRIFNGFSPFLYKRKSFEHEREVRALIWRPSTTAIEVQDDSYQRFQDTIAHGIQIKVDVERLVEKIYVAPTAPDWFLDLVISVMQHYCFKFKIVRSELDEQPLF